VPGRTSCSGWCKPGGGGTAQPLPGLMLRGPTVLRARAAGAPGAPSPVNGKFSGGGPGRRAVKRRHGARAGMYAILGAGPAEKKRMGTGLGGPCFCRGKLILFPFHRKGRGTSDQKQVLRGDHPSGPSQLQNWGAAFARAARSNPFKKCGWWHGRVFYGRVRVAAPRRFQGSCKSKGFFFLLTKTFHGVSRGKSPAFLRFCRGTLSGPNNKPAPLAQPPKTGGAPVFDFGGRGHFYHGAGQNWGKQKGPERRDGTAKEKVGGSGFLNGWVGGGILTTWGEEVWW